MSTLKSIIVSATLFSLAVFSSASDATQSSCLQELLSPTKQQTKNLSLY